MWIKDKASQFWFWIKRQAKKITIALGIAGVAVAMGGLIEPVSIQSDYLLKGTVIQSQEIDWIIENIISTSTGTDKSIKNNGKIIYYDYISDEEVLPATYNGIPEDITKRNGSQQFFLKKKTAKEETWMVKTYMPTVIERATNKPVGPFFKKPGNKWYRVKQATTTIDAWLKQTNPTVLEKWLGVYADTATSTYSGVGDGHEDYEVAGSWATAHNAATGTTGSATAPSYYIAQVYRDNAASYNIYRGFLPFYTAGIPAGNTITTSTLFLWGYYAPSSKPDPDWVVVVQTNQPDHTTLSTADYDAFVGGVHGAAQGSNQFDTDNVIITQYTDFQLNATGRGWIKMNGQTSTCGTSLTGWTCLGVMESQDITDTAPTVDGEISGMAIRFSEYSSTDPTKLPYMTIQYTVAATPVPPNQYNLIIFE